MEPHGKPLQTTTPSLKPDVLSPYRTKPHQDPQSTRTGALRTLNSGVIVTAGCSWVVEASLNTQIRKP